MLWEYVPMGRNPMELVTIKNGSKRQREPRVLTLEEFQALLAALAEPYRTMVLVDQCLGLRFSELIALKWGDVDWFGRKLRIQRAMVVQHEGDVKTAYSGKPMPLDQALIKVLQGWHSTTQFRGVEDWVWASPQQAGELPYSYTATVDAIKAAASAAGLNGIAWHTFRHTYRSWLNSVGAPLAVQQKLMRHADIRTTMNTYGDALPDELREAHGKVVRMVLPA